MNVAVHAIQVNIWKTTRLEVREPADPPFYCPETGIDKVKIVLFYLYQGRTVVYVEDGFTDSMREKKERDATLRNAGAVVLAGSGRKTG